MNVGASIGALGSAAGSSLAQAAGETERAQKEAGVEQRHVEGQAKSERASGIGQAEQDEQTSERDADGRRLWEQGPDGGQRKEAVPEAERKAKDPTGMSGNSLDLTG